jgi:hypothetical protein
LPTHLTLRVVTDGTAFSVESSGDWDAKICV